MSGYGFSVWYSQERITPSQAKEIVQRVGSDTVIFARDSRFEAFLAELRGRYPDLAPFQVPQFKQWGLLDPFLRSIQDPRPPSPTQEQIRAAEAGPPSVWNGGISQQGIFASMSLHWEQSVEVFPYVKALASKFGLTVYDESGQLEQPAGLISGVQPAILRLSVTLHIKGKPPALDASITDGQVVLAHEVVENRLQAHMRARALATQRNEIGYHVDDPQCVAQAYTFVPVEIGPTPPGVTVYQIKPSSQ